MHTQLQTHTCIYINIYMHPEETLTHVKINTNRILIHTHRCTDTYIPINIHMHPEEHPHYHMMPG